LSQEGASKVRLRILEDLQTKPDAHKGGLEEGGLKCLQKIKSKTSKENKQSRLLKQQRWNGFQSTDIDAALTLNNTSTLTLEIEVSSLQEIGQVHHESIPNSAFIRNEVGKFWSHITRWSTFLKI